MISRAIPNSCRIYTAPPLARAIVDALGDQPRALWLEPSVGRGVFVDTLCDRGVPKARIRAIDIDGTQQLSDLKARTVRSRDFLAWARNTRERFDRVVSNPPFVSLEVLGSTLRRAACDARTLSSLPIPPGSNYWYAFLCSSIALLKPAGSIGFVLPAAWDYADYARNLRSTIHEFFGDVVIHRCQKPLFDNVQEGAVVLIARDFGKKQNRCVRASYCSSRELLNGVRTSAADDLHHIAPRVSDGRVASPNCVRLGDLVKISIGAVTGDADFFLLSEKRRRNLKLPITCVRPVLTRAKQLIACEVTQALWRSMRDNEERVWLFYPSRRDKNHSAVRSYLRLTAEKGGCNRKAFKVKSRSPWFQVTLPSASHGFMSGMGQGSPWICFNAMPRLTASNTLYTVTFRREYSTQQKFAIAIGMQTTEGARAIAQRGRQYAEGLIKFEPGDLVDVLVPIGRCARGAKGIYRKIVLALLAGDRTEAHLIADRFVAG